MSKGNGEGVLTGARVNIKLPSLGRVVQMHLQSGEMAETLESVEDPTRTQRALALLLRTNEALLAMQAAGMQRAQQAQSRIARPQIIPPGDLTRRH